MHVCVVWCFAGNAEALTSLMMLLRKERSVGSVAMSGGESGDWLYDGWTHC